MNYMTLSTAIVVLFFSQSTAEQTTRSPIIAGYPCPQVDIAGGCSGPKDCLYPNPENCKQLLHCEVNADNRTGRLTVIDCPSGLEWNDKDKICDWPNRSTCPSRRPFVCPSKDIIETKCMGPKDCRYPNPKNCKTFIQCTVNFDGRSGTPVVMPCPAGLEYNKQDKICDWHANSTCIRG